MHDRGPVKTALLLGFCALGCTAQELRVYAIEVECGKATLYVSPSGESMLADAGHAEALDYGAPGGRNPGGAPALVQALRPKAAIMNNGGVLGASEPAWQTIDRSPGHPDIWQLHYAGDNDPKHNAPSAFIANKGAKCQGYWIKLTARTDGSFTIQNGRTQKEKQYR